MKLPFFFYRNPPRWPQEAPRRLQEASKRPPRCPQEAPKRPQEAPPRHPRRSKKPPGPPRGPQDAPRGLQEAPKRHPKRLREASKRPLALLLVLPSSSSASSSSSLLPLPHLLLRFLLHPPLLGYGGIPRPSFLCMLPHFPDQSNSSGHRCWKDDRQIPIIGTLRKIGCFRMGWWGFFLMTGTREVAHRQPSETERIAHKQRGRKMH